MQKNGFQASEWLLRYDSEVVSPVTVFGREKRGSAGNDRRVLAVCRT